jgi:hypothetical protein
MLLASDDIVFAWAIAKASLIVIASFGSLVYVAWAVTYQKESGTHLGIPNNHAYKSSVKAPRSRSLQTEQLDAGKLEQPAAAA